MFCYLPSSLNVRVCAAMETSAAAAAAAAKLLLDIIKFEAIWR